MESLRARDNRWFAPALLRYEFLNVLTRYIHQRLLTRDDAIKAYRRGLSTLEIDETIPDPVQVFNLHLSSDCTSYDCEFIALACNLNLKLVTLDQQLVRAFATVAVSPEQI